MSVDLGPVSPTLAEPEVLASASWSGSAYNPRCLKKDVSEWVSSQWSTDQNSTDLITRRTDIGSFQTFMQGNFATRFYGVHTAGHFTIGDAPGGDPAFWLHWWIWQNQDLKNRQNAIAGTITLNNNPPSRNGTLQDIMDLGVNNPGIQIVQTMSTLAGPFCYIYV